ncbi:hypothetical protein CYMTET_46345 [Cymbomonas tetramitiformis]|uniref:Uncharacterized protein n=1 Tax=Cymbomonas tetramitiformis TaxID=36881 RepID=A0AAE0EXP4_9CHLO|nr:hypothetical protein CYMTET_46345 [Cymbomonas tetramitiformis]
MAARDCSQQTAPIDCKSSQGGLWGPPDTRHLREVRRCPAFHCACDCAGRWRRLQGGPSAAELRAIPGASTHATDPERSSPNAAVDTDMLQRRPPPAPRLPLPEGGVDARLARRLCRLFALLFPSWRSLSSVALVVSLLMALLAAQLQVTLQRVQASITVSLVENDEATLRLIGHGTVLLALKTTLLTISGWIGQARAFLGPLCSERMHGLSPGLRLPRSVLRASAASPAECMIRPDLPETSDQSEGFSGRSELDVLSLSLACCHDGQAYAHQRLV